MSTTIAIAASANANAAAANANYLAAKAREQACEALVQSYRGSTDPVVMRHYADCVLLLYPDPMSPESRWLLQVLSLTLLAVFLCSVAFCRARLGEEWGMAICSAMLVVVGFVVLLAVIVWFLYLFM